jgi:glutamate/tyrosine decarboxylase-like PLP-dependent enzyme
MSECDSITLDPHKLGYVPYSSGVFLCKEKKNYFIKSFTGPYIVSDVEDVGNFTLEGSRAATGAVATYTSLKAFGAVQGYERVLTRTLNTKKQFEKKLQTLSVKVFLPGGLDTNIVCFVPVVVKTKLSALNAQTQKIYDLFQVSNDYWISKTTLEKSSYTELVTQFCQEYQIEMDSASLILLRLTLMNPFVISRESKVDHCSNFCTLLEELFHQVQF